MSYRYEATYKEHNVRFTFMYIYIEIYVVILQEQNNETDNAFEDQSMS